MTRTSVDAATPPLPLLKGRSPSRPRLIGRAVALALLLAAADQASKAWGMANLLDPPRRIEVTGFLNLTPVWNPGVSFGLFNDLHDSVDWLVTLIPALIAALIGYWLVRSERLWTALALGSIQAGAVGNLIDRFRFGAVFDFIDVHALGWHFWTFNIADAAISLGVIALFIDGLWNDRAKSS